MPILHITDIHADLKSLDHICEITNIDLIIISGDITHFGKPPEMKLIIQQLKKRFSQNIYCVTGNCDFPETLSVLVEEKVNVQNRVIQFENYQICGIGGSLPCPGTTPNEYSEQRYICQLHELKKDILPEKPIILVSHQPPYNTKNDKVLLGMHVGSKSIRKFIERIKPLACLTGHIHEGKGVDFIGECPIINPGPFRNGHYAIIQPTGEQGPLVNLY